jgi:putative endonuclease
MMTYCIYIMADESGVIYIGVTNDLERRIFEHKTGAIPGFSARYKLKKAVYFELFADVRAAIAREKQLKGWLRKRKVALIESVNPNWNDLAEQLPTKYHGQQQIPHPRSPKPGRPGSG